MINQSAIPEATEYKEQTVSYDDQYYSELHLSEFPYVLECVIWCSELCDTAIEAKRQSVKEAVRRRLKKPRD